MENQIVQKTDNNELTFIFTTDENFIPYLGVAIQSLIDSSSSENMYKVHILEENLSEEAKRKILLLEKDNVKINFINISPYFEKYSRENFPVNAYYAIATYFRIFIPDIFSQFDKVVFLDSDMIFLKDVAELYKIDINDNYMAAVQDIGLYLELCKSNNNVKDYLSNKLCLKNIYNYFNAGIMILNLKQMREVSFMEESLKMLKELPNPKYLDQDIYNVLCNQRLKLLDFKWNMQNGKIKFDEETKKLIPEEKFNDLKENCENPYIIHYTGGIRPWTNPKIPFAEKFWQTARRTPFYEEIIYDNIKSLNPPKKKTKKDSLLKKIFSVKNEYVDDKKYKIITILGLKIKI